MLPTKTGAALLLRVFPRSSHENRILTTSRIAERPGGLALAIDQASAFVQYHQCSIDRLSEFLDLYEAQRVKVLRQFLQDFWKYGAMHVTERARYSVVSTFTTWDMSFQSLCQERREQREAMAHLLNPSAFLAPIVVSESLFRHHWRWSDDSFD